VREQAIVTTAHDKNIIIINSSRFFGGQQWVLERQSWVVQGMREKQMCAIIKLRWIIFSPLPHPPSSKTPKQ